MLMGRCPRCRQEDRSQMHTGYDSTAINSSSFLTSYIYHQGLEEGDEEEVSILSLNVGGGPRHSSPPPAPEMQPAQVSENTPNQQVSENLSDSSPSTEDWVTVTPSAGTDSEATTHVQQDSNAEITNSRQMNPSRNRVSRKRKSPSSKSSSDFTTTSTDSDSDLAEVPKKKPKTRHIPRSQPHHEQNHRRSQDDRNSGVAGSRTGNTHRHRGSRRYYYRRSKKHQSSSTSQAGPSSQPSSSNTPSSGSTTKVKIFSFESTDEEQRHKLKFRRFIRDLVLEFEPNVYENCGVDPESLQDLDESIQFHQKKLKEYAAVVRENNYRSRAEYSSSLENSGDSTS